MDSIEQTEHQEEGQQNQNIALWVALGVFVLFIGMLTLYYAPYLRARVLSGTDVSIVDGGSLIAGSTTEIQLDATPGFVKQSLASSSLEFCYGVFAGRDCVPMERVGGTGKTMTVIIPMTPGSGYVRLVGQRGESQIVYTTRPARITE